MTVVWCSISAHGFGHAAQLTPILNELGTMIDDLQLILRTQVPAHFFERHLQVKWKIQAAQQDVGCTQRGPLDVDVCDTWEAYAQFHTNWERKIVEETAVIRAAKANLVISNISYLAIAGAAQVPCPVVAIASLSWDRVLEPFMEIESPIHQSILATIRNGYALTDQLIRLHPGIEMPAFPSTIDVGPSVSLHKPHSYSLRNFLQVPDGDLLVLIAFGGVPLTRLPLEQMETMSGFQFLVSDLSSSTYHARVHRIEDLPLPFSEISHQVDIIMTKPGYGTVMEAVHGGKALVYVRRRNFIDEQSLVDYTHRYGRGLELSRDDFESGNWEGTLRAVLTLPDPSEPPSLPGNNAVAHLLRAFLQG